MEVDANLIKEYGLKIISTDKIAALVGGEGVHHSVFRNETGWVCIVVPTAITKQDVVQLVKAFTEAVKETGGKVSGERAGVAAVVRVRGRLALERL